MHACAHTTPLPLVMSPEDIEPWFILFCFFFCQLSVPKVIFKLLLVIVFGDGSLLFEADFLGTAVLYWASLTEK